MFGLVRRTAISLCPGSAEGSPPGRPEPRPHPGARWTPAVGPRAPPKGPRMRTDSRTTEIHKSSAASEETCC